MALEQIIAGFESLPGCQDGLFKGLWKERRLKYGRAIQQPHDHLDENCARLICATITSHERLLLVLPDYQPHRPALLFATALLRCWRDTPSQISVERRKVLYFGTTIGIREQLGQIRIPGFRENLSEVFQQHDVGRRNTGTATVNPQNKIRSDSLPKVITIYSPADPIPTIRQHKPQCIAVDLDDAAKADWLIPLLEEATQHQIPVVAWGVNPLSECVKGFRKNGQVVAWPPQLRNANSYDGSDAVTQLHTLMLEGDGVEQATNIFSEATRLSVKALQRTSGRLGQDAVRQHWWYLHALESLFVPHDFHEVESSHFWGMKTFAHLRAGCEQFRKACAAVDPLLTAELEQIVIACEKAEGIFQNGNPPLWNALCNLCLDEPSNDKARVIVFSGLPKKQLFLLALLAYHNFTESDLREVRTWVSTPDELRRLLRQRNFTGREDQPFFINPELNWHPLLVGVPGANLTPKLLPLMRQEDIDVVLYPHQLSALKRRASEWEQAVSLSPNGLAVVLQQLGGQLASQTSLPEIIQAKPRINLNDPVNLNAGTARRRPVARVERLWQPDDPVVAVTSLLQIDEDQLDDPTIFDELRPNSPVAERDSWCDEAVELHFQSGARITYPSDEFINVIVTGPNGLEVDERSVRSLRKGARVVLIHGQQRQSFYELIVLRMHQHPSMILHLSLVQRWQADFVNAFYRWRGGDSYSLEQLLERMEDRGSTLSSTATLQNWLRGHALCPQDAEDLRRLAEILAMDFVRQNYKRIVNAASRLRGLHRGLANKLNRWLQQQAAGIDSANEGELIDVELGLTFGDLKSSLSIQQIANVQPVSGPLLRSSLGKLEI